MLGTMTDERVAQLFSMQRDAAIGVRAGTVVFINAVSKRQFPELTVGADVSILLPPAICETGAENFSTTVTVKDQLYTLLGTQAGDLCVYTLIPQVPEADGPEGQLLERVCSAMRRTLTVLNMATESLAPAIEQTEEPKQRQNLTMINKTYYQLQRLCDNLDHFARLTRGQARLYLENTDLVKFCGDLVRSTDHFARKLSKRVHFQTDLNQLPAVLDRQKVTKLILNLISNSMKHLSEGDSLTLHLTSQGEDAVLTLRDTGTGIAQGQMAEIFTQYQGRRSDTDIQAGVGLGLSIAQEIARLHGGTMLMTGGEHGATLRLRLPTRQDPDSGVLQETALPYGEGNDGMHLILTELSDVLDDEAFLGQYD